MFSKGAKSHFALAVLLLASLLQACSGGGSSDSVEVDPNTVSIGGTIEGLAGEITVSIILIRHFVEIQGNKCCHYSNQALQRY